MTPGKEAVRVSIWPWGSRGHGPPFFNCLPYALRIETAMDGGNGNGRPAALAGYQAPAVQKAFDILRKVAAAPNRLGLSELAAELGYSKSTTHGLVHALLREGALAQNSHGKKLAIGPLIVDLAFKGWNYLKISRLAQPLLDELRDRIGETVFMGVLHQGKAKALIMATAEAAKPLKISSPPGTSLSLFAGAVGKVFMSGVSDEMALEMIGEKGLPGFTERSITRIPDYLSELARVRAQGYAVDNEEYLPGVKAVAVGVGNTQGLPMALWVVGFASAMDALDVKAIVAAMLETVEKLNHMLEEEM